MSLIPILTEQCTIQMDHTLVINEIVFNFQPWLDWYLNTDWVKRLGRKCRPLLLLEDMVTAMQYSGALDSGDAGGYGGDADATSGASNQTKKGFGEPNWLLLIKRSETKGLVF